MPNVERPYCADFDECSDPRNSVNNKSYCVEHTKCTDTPGSFSCPCNSGFEKFVGGKGCSDINECQQHSTKSHCGKNTNCNNTIGSWNCGEHTCKDGYFNWRSSAGTNGVFWS